VDERELATKYVPELAGSGLVGATVRQLLDMYTGVRAPCFPSPKEIGTTDEVTLKQWALGTPEFRRADHVFARMCRAMGAFPGLPGEEMAGCYDFLLTTERDREHGKYFYYTDPNPMALQWILERVTNTSYVEHLSRLLQNLGAECNGTVTLDPIGTAVSSIGLSLTARDFARWGLMLCNGGRVGSGTVIAGIKDFIDDIRRNPGPERWTERTNTVALPNTGYRSLMWTTPAEPGREPIPNAQGAHYQKCYVDAARNCVVVKLSSFSNAQPGRPVEDQPNQNDDVAMQSFLGHVLPELIR
jgi:CubicO group peptidase (beta-lactamase class C family)